jgi:hypothetical protein
MGRIFYVKFLVDFFVSSFDYELVYHCCVFYTCVGDIGMQAFVWALILYYMALIFFA